MARSPPSVNTANIPYLTRPGYVRYNISGGTPSRYNHKLQGPTFLSGDFSRGVSNAWSLYGGLQSSGEEYTAASLGIGRDLNALGPFPLMLPNHGAVSLTVNA